MPELPEVEVLVRHLDPLLRGKTVRDVEVHREKVIRPDTVRQLSTALNGARLRGVRRRGKFMLFDVKRPGEEPQQVLGHLGMTGRMFVQPARDPLPKHTAVSLALGRERFIYQDTRYFGRFTLDLSSIEKLGPEPFDDLFTAASFRRSLAGSRQAIKVKLLDQSMVVGVGNIYASEALHRAGISPRKAARRLTVAECARLHEAVVRTLSEAVEYGSTIPLNFGEGGRNDGLFYYGSDPGAAEYQHEQLRVYARAGEPCLTCDRPLKRIVQAARSTFFCPACQR